MDTPALQDLLENTRRLFPEERLELTHLIGRIARLERIEKDVVALVAALPSDLKKLDLGSDTTKAAFKAFVRAVRAK